MRALAAEIDERLARQLRKLRASPRGESGALGPVQMRALELIKQHGPLTVEELADKLGTINNQAIGAAAGLIARGRVLRDGRALKLAPERAR